MPGAGGAENGRSVNQGLCRSYAPDFERHYWPACRQMATDNEIGKIIFAVTRLVQKVWFAKGAIHRMVTREQRAGGPRSARMSLVLWDTFTGSAPYREILWRTVHPSFWLPFLWNILASLLAGRRRMPAPSGDGEAREARTMEAGELGRVLEPGETLFGQGDPGDCMFVIQEGRVEIVIDGGGGPVRIAERAAGECVGEMALFEREVRMATVRALERTRVLTVDRKNLVQRIHDDPSLGYRLIQTLSQRLRQLTHEVVHLKQARQAADCPPSTHR